MRAKLPLRLPRNLVRFWPGRGTHDALDALCVGIDSKKVSFILDELCRFIRSSRRRAAAEDRCARGVSNNRTVERERRLLRRLERFLPGNVDRVGQY